MTVKIVFPITQEKAVKGYIVSISKTWEAREGLGFNGKLKKGSKTVAEVYQAGDGGMVNVYFISREEESAFNKYVELWDFTWGEAFGESFPHDKESVINVLADESIEARRWNRSKKLYIRKAKDGNLYTANFNITKGTTVLPESLHAQLQNGDQFWNKQEWVTV